MRVHPAWWHFVGAIVTCCFFIVGGFACEVAKTNARALGLILMMFGAAGFAQTALRRRFISWSPPRTTGS